MYPDAGPTDLTPDFYLASSSPRRRALLDSQGYCFGLVNAVIEEIPGSDEDAVAYVRRMALGKARAGRGALAQDDHRPVLGADTEVVVDGTILGKPVDLPDLRRMLGLLSGRSHRVLSAVVLDDGRRAESVLTETRVHMRSISEAEIQAYWASGEPGDKAGGYAIQGLAAVFVTGIEGSYTGVVGLPLSETAGLLRGWGIEGWQRRAVACAHE